MKVCVEVSVAPDNPSAPSVTEREEIELSIQSVHDFVESMERGQGPTHRIQLLTDAAVPSMVRKAILSAAAEEVVPSLKRYIVTVQVPMFHSVTAHDEDEAKGIAADHWHEQRLDLMLENMAERSDWYVSDVDLFESHDTTVTEDESHE